MCPFRVSCACDECEKGDILLWDQELACAAADDHTDATDHTTTVTPVDE